MMKAYLYRYGRRVYYIYYAFAQGLDLIKEEAALPWRPASGATPIDGAAASKCIGDEAMSAKGAHGSDVDYD